jgi:phage repressor protein C with HTH and peptisase S24 domain
LRASIPPLSIRANAKPRTESCAGLRSRRCFDRLDARGIPRPDRRDEQQSAPAAAPHSPCRPAQAGSSGYFDDAGFPAGGGWEEVAFPELGDAHAYALEITGQSMLPVYRDGDHIIVSPLASTRRGDRLVVKTTSGEVMAKILRRVTLRKVELQSFHATVQDRVLEPADVAFVHRIIWASQ